MRRRDFLALVAGAAINRPFGANVQQPVRASRTVHIGRTVTHAFTSGPVHLSARRQGMHPIYSAARIACAVFVPLASAASTVPISRPAYSASPEKNTAPGSNFRSAVCASRVLGVA